ncbi:hypothetical protein AMQ84_27280 [Paenibacillus riograndensis]|uniref:Copper amine oxidase-like N-terminal domain-containing protein n=1 Tax=Paenibacillus riograndensis TaxID=483937 RepID=A0A132TJT4_9BACL|nr:hypothetical protein [Paenibacillus riograndensis]KWX71627.1 hypothetical protein AMQ84_27280 [Paenibacillus riograndensis]
MKKFGMLVIGIVIGATITLSPQIYGAGAKLLGSKVDNTLDIKLNGSSIGQGAVINGTSYLPVRSAANALGLEVSVDSNQVNLSGNSSEENAKIAQEQQAEMDKATKISELKIFIEASQKKIKSKEAIIASGEKTVLSYKEKVEYLNSTGIGDQVTRDTTNKAYTDAQAALEANKSALAAEQKNLADLQAQLAELQGQ